MEPSGSAKKDNLWGCPFWPTPVSASNNNCNFLFIWIGNRRFLHHHPHLVGGSCTLRSALSNILGNLLSDSRNYIHPFSFSISTSFAPSSGRRGPWSSGWLIFVGVLKIAFKGGIVKRKLGNDDDKLKVAKWANYYYCYDSSAISEEDRVFPSKLVINRIKYSSKLFSLYLHSLLDQRNTP